MQQFEFTVKANAVNFVKFVDKALNYPRDGVNVGSGRHAPPELSITASFFDKPEKHPTLAVWALPAPPEVIAVYNSDPRFLGLTTLVERLPSWNPVVDMHPPTITNCPTCGKPYP